MKFLITVMFLASVALAIRQQEDTLVLADSSTTLHAKQQLRLGNCSFSPLYLHVFEFQKDGPVKHVNLTDEMKNSVMKIESFKLLVDKDISTWVAYLKRDDDEKIYVCEIQEALNTREIILLN